MQRPLHDRSMPDDSPALLGDDVRPAKGVLPVLLGHPPVVVIVSERGPQEVAQLGELPWAQPRGRDPADGRLGDLPAPR